MRIRSRHWRKSIHRKLINLIVIFLIIDFSLMHNLIIKKIDCFQTIKTRMGNNLKFKTGHLIPNILILRVNNGQLVATARIWSLSWINQEYPNYSPCDTCLFLDNRSITNLINRYTQQQLGNLILSWNVPINIDFWSDMLKSSKANYTRNFK